MSGEAIYPVIAVTANGRLAARAGAAVLAAGGAALDAVEAAVNVIEDDPDEWSVGLGGFPNYAGQVELDASIIDGRTRRCGAVAAFTFCAHAVSVARRLMEKTPHVLLAGAGADRFARGEGFARQELTTERTREAHARLMRGQPVELWPRTPDEDPEDARRYGEFLGQLARDRAWWGERYGGELHGTCNALAIDAEGGLASAVSTSGLALKLPGRVGDSPVPGAGNYADGRYGAAACCGNGELTLRLCAARAAVERLARGLSAEAAAVETVRELADLPERAGGFQVLVMDRLGQSHLASSNREPAYFLMRPGELEPRRIAGTFVRL